MSDDVVRRARSLIGCRFRPQGRDPKLGLDCVGLVSAVFDIPADSIPRDYPLRSGAVERLRTELKRFFRPIPNAVAGDILTLEVATDQLHLGIMTDRGFIHADARLRLVVETPGMAPWPLLSAHRRKES